MAVNVELIKELIEVQIELMNLNLKKLYVPAQGIRKKLLFNNAFQFY